ncbi:MAG: diversity-generating retroelement protein Avd [Myxococcales bacterium]|nr:diversity-generating retroelement protein Avd [Myxococcales bacterium]
MNDDRKQETAPESPGPKGRPPEKKSPPPPVIALRMETLLTWTVERVAKFPRDHKFTVGDRLIETCLDITTALVEASYKRDKAHELAAASRALVRARVLVRLAAHLRCLSGEQHHHFVKESDEVGRMLGGWLRSAASR